MPRSKGERYIPKGMKQIMGLLYLFLGHYPLGLYPFTNRTPFPESAEIAEMVSLVRCGGDLGCHIDGGSKTPAAQKMIESADQIRDIISKNGGLNVYYNIFEWYEKECPERINILRDLSMLKSPGFMTKMQIASAHNMSIRTMDRERDLAILHISREIYRRGQLLSSEYTPVKWYINRR